MKHINQFVHLPRSAGKSFIQKQQSQFIGNTDKSNFAKNLIISGYTIDDLCVSALTYTRDNVTSKSTLNLNTSNCNFDKVTTDFLVRYVCVHCRKKQVLFSTSQLNQLLKISHKTSIVQSTCTYCFKKTKYSTFSLFKKTLQAYTQQPIEKLPNNLNGIVHMLLEYIDFYETLVDTPTSGTESYDKAIHPYDTSAYHIVQSTP